MTQGGFIPNTDETRVPPGQRQKTLLGGTQVTQTPAVYFGGDIIIGASTSQSIDITGLVGGRCTGFVLAAIVGTVQYSINGGGLRTCPSAIAVNSTMMNSLSIVTGPASSCILQLHGV